MIHKRNLTGIVLAACLTLLANPSIAKEIPVTPEQQARYYANKKLELGQVGNDWRAGCGDVISASFVDIVAGNNDRFVSVEELKAFFDKIGKNTVFYSIVLGSNVSAIVDHHNPFTNNPLDYDFLPGQSNVHTTRQEVESAIKEIERQVPRHKGKLSYIQIEDPRVVEKPLKVTSYYERKGNLFVERDVLGYEHNPQMAKIVGPNINSLADLFGNRDGITTLEENSKLDSIIKQSPDGYIWAVIAIGIPPAKCLPTSIEQFNGGNLGAMALYRPFIVGPTFESVERGKNIRTPTSLVKIDPPKSKIVGVYRYNGTPKYIAK